ncbi:MAG TPA: lysine exporter LysO family protein [Firmicutes bacterium]|nr:lysine exporter LysO family protein [Bacillota bacterium]
MLAILALTLTGVILGRWRRLPPGIAAATGTMIIAGLIVLLLAMGAQIGSNRELAAQLPTLGLQAFLLAMATIVGSLAAVLPWQKFILGTNRAQTTPAAGKPRGLLRATGYVVPLAFLAGILIGRCQLPGQILASLEMVTMIVLYGLLVVVGIEIGRSLDQLPVLQAAGWRLLLLPLLIALGSIIAAAGMGLALGVTWQEGAAVGAGFGWYSLSGVILAKLHSTHIGALAFLTNIGRELLAICIIPPVAARFGNLAAIAPGGATAMDTTLPIIARATDGETALLAFTTGVLLSALVPMLVPFLIFFL